MRRSPPTRAWVRAFAVASAAAVTAVVAPSARAAGAESARDGSFCGFLTRPSIRADGGGTNFHRAGQFLCLDGRAMRCERHRWRDAGPCSVFGALPDAYEFERSQHESLVGEWGFTGDGGSRGASGADGSEEREAPTEDTDGLLKGESSEARRLEGEIRGLHAERQRLLKSAEGARATGAAGAAAVPKVDVARCAQLADAIRRVDGELRKIREFGVAWTNDGSTPESMVGAKRELERARRELESERGSLGC